MIVTRNFSCLVVILFYCLPLGTSETLTTIKPTGPPKLRPNEASNFEVPVGERCKLRCPLQHSGVSVHVKWFKGGVPNGEGEERVRLGKSALIIANVTWADEGEYECRASNEYGEVRSGFTVKVIGEWHLLLRSLDIYVDPHIFDEPGEEEDFFREVGPNDEYAPRFSSKMNDLLTRPAGASAVLRYNAHGNPHPTVHWTKNGNSVSYRSAYQTVLPAEGEESESEVGGAAVTMETSSHPQFRPLFAVAATCVRFAAPAALLGALVCRCRYRREQMKALMQGTTLMVTKKVVLEKREPTTWTPR
ncbi:hypothetical protein JTE90_006292 [Oedothorax gibbosus]|uniref:Ig-like domain-containing protein n=1 Tax=Oedothorax gibbosus TaxID=931172 RepID=A0AAV6U2G7_9ARAC|nr:hypothetical protein JTE90_006292 [Oedothorax gibbosus]